MLDVQQVPGIKHLYVKTQAQVHVKVRKHCTQVQVQVLEKSPSTWHQP